MPKKIKVREMFDNISTDYDRLNHILSLNIDKIWRNRGIKSIIENADGHKQLQVIDLACGTGDFSIALAKKLRKKAIGGDIVGVDMSEGMLEIMKGKVNKDGLQDMISIKSGDGEDLKFEDNSFDRACIAFGIRNFENREKGLSELLRVLKPGGRLVILELSRPDNGFIRFFYELYFLKILPFVGGLVSGNKAAYNYLPKSVISFPHYRDFMSTMKQVGYDNVRQVSLSCGICRMYIGEKV